jgi:hypothetical protein
MFKRSYLLAAVAAATLSGTATAAPFTLDFEGIGSQCSISGFYNGGTSDCANPANNTSGTNYGIQFGDSALALREDDPMANIGLLPSSPTGMIFLTTTAILTFADGFDTGFSFFYSTVAFTGVVQVFDGVNGTGNVIGSINLAALGVGPSPGNDFSNWAVGTVSFPGIGRSINFGGTANQVVYDNVTFGSTTPGGGGSGVPEPASLVLVGSALLGLAAARRRRTT